MNKRVHQIAKERGLPPKDVLARLRAAGIDVTASSSSVDEDVATRVLGGGSGPTAANGGNGTTTANGGNGATAANGGNSSPPANGGTRSSAADGPRAAAGGGSSAPAARPRPSTAGLRRVTISDGPDQRRSTPRRATPSAPADPSPADAARAAAEAAQAARARAQAAGDPRRGQAGDPRRAAASGRPGRPAPLPRMDPRTPPPSDPRRGQAGDGRRSQGGQAGQTGDPRRNQGARAPQGEARREVDARANLPQRQQGLGGSDTRRGGAQGELRPPRSQRDGGGRRQPAGPTPGAVAREAAAAVGRAREVAADPRTQRATTGRPGAIPAPRVEPPAAEKGAAAADAAKQRPTRDSLQGERAPGNAGGRRRVVIDSQASRRQAGGPPPATNQPPRRQRRGRRRRGTYDDAVESQPKASVVEATAIQIISGSTVKDVAEYLDVSTSEIIKKLMALGEMRTLTQTLSDETIEVLATELGKEVEIVHSEDEEIDEEQYDDADEDLVERAPVVTIMGHVDHGKTSLLDAIRETSVAAGEAGGITQHIGAYQVEHGGHEITFLDTPGHEAFTAMRARGARVTDIAVIVVAADDGVKPQTQEAVDHAKEAEVPILVAVNKIDKEGAQPDRVRAEMAQLGLQPVQWGGDTEFVDVSAKTRQGLDDLLETIVVMAEVEELKANPNVPASGSVIESKLDPGRGPVVTILVSRGTLKVGDALVAGAQWGRVRAMQDYLGQRITAARPGEPVEVLGFDGVPEAGEHVRVVEHERRARQLAMERATRLKAESLARVGSGKRVSLENIFGSDLQELNLVLKADVAGSLEAIEDEIAKLPQDEVSVNVIRRAVGAVTESDVMLAAASDAVILAFNVRPVGDARAAAEREGVEIRSYSVIYRAIEELRQAMQGMLAPEEVEEALGSAEVRQIFRASRVGTIAGSYVTEGRITRGSKVRLVRDGTVVWDGEIASLRRFNEDAREVAAGFECGIVLRDYADVKEGDVLETYTTRQVERELA